MGNEQKEKQDITVQSMVFPNAVCDEQELFFRTSGKVKIDDNTLYLPTGTTLCTNTYMNCFDANTWSIYTNIQKWKLILEMRGSGNITLYSSPQKRVLGSIKSENSKEIRAYAMEFEIPKIEEFVYFEATTQEELYITDAYYVPVLNQQVLNEIHISLIICTYKRNAEVMKNIQNIQSSLFFQRNTQLYGKLSIRIVDNASELEERNDAYIKVYHNPNTGGSGGFIRGILETRKDALKYKISHAIFMDDDVQFINETLYRLYGLLALMIEMYQQEVVAGRMFRMDQRNIQYTATEIWNGGDIIHIGLNQNMCKKKNLMHMNVRKGEYTGWWFGCFPMDFVKKELPLPFFLHCDDVEYGLRHGGCPITLNGIQVWHETYESRMTSTIQYYDMRNTLIVNTIRGYFKNEKELWSWWKQSVGSYAGCVALNDYLKGASYFEKYNQKKECIKRNILLDRIYPYIFRIFIRQRFMNVSKSAFKSYKERYANNL